MSDFERFRASLLHTPANPFHDTRALVGHEDGGLLVHNGRIIASGEYAAVRASYASVIGTIVATGVAAVFVPALRVIRVDPVAALRAE